MDMTCGEIDALVKESQEFRARLKEWCNEKGY